MRFRDSQGVQRWRNQRKAKMDRRHGEQRRLRLAPKGGTTFASWQMARWSLATCRRGWQK